MPSDREIHLLLRRFLGVNIAQDSAFVDPSYLQQCDSWIPNTQFLLSKRDGDSFLLSVGDLTFTGPDYLTFTYDRTNTNKLLFMTIQRSAGGDQIYASTNEGAFALVTGGAAFSNGKIYNGAVLGEVFYIGNGTDNLKKISLGAPTTATDIVALGTFTTTAPTTTPADTSSQATLDNGVYSFLWAAMDETTGNWTAISDTHTITISGTTAPQYATFTSPVVGEYSLVAHPNDKFHLFIAPVGLPIEFAHDHTAAGVGQAVVVNVRAILVDTTPVPQRGAIRTGKFFVTHRGRLWIAGDDTASGANTSKVYATATIIPGLEQTIFNLGNFFPYNAVINVSPNDGDFITGLGVATLTTTTLLPSAPLLIFKNNSTWAFIGDILDDDTAILVQLSGHIGCVSHRSIVNTPQGVIFVGTESVYLITRDTMVPIDIGWPIAPAIKAIPRNVRNRICAVYHKNFYKLAISTPGNTTNVTEWWLDMRPGTSVGTTPSWWGPHTEPAYVAMTVNRRDNSEQDRGYGLQHALGAVNSCIVNVLQQTNARTDRYPIGSNTIVSRLLTKALDNGVPFQRKIFTRIRANGRTDANGTSVGLTVNTDGGIAITANAMTFDGSSGSAWNSATWNISNWSSLGVFNEGESILQASRPRGNYVEIAMTHNLAAGIDLRDFEVKYLPVERDVQ